MDWGLEMSIINGGDTLKSIFVLLRAFCDFLQVLTVPIPFLVGFLPNIAVAVTLIIINQSTTDEKIAFLDYFLSKNGYNKISDRENVFIGSGK